MTPFGSAAILVVSNPTNVAPEPWVSTTLDDFGATLALAVPPELGNLHAQVGLTVPSDTCQDPVRLLQSQGVGVSGVGAVHLYELQH